MTTRTHPRTALPWLLAIGGLTLTGLVITTVAAISSHYLHQATGTDCQTLGTTHSVTIQANRMSPTHTTAYRCDQLTITNRDPQDREIAFGPHDHHIAVGGITEQSLAPDHSFTITLNQTGSYRLHDHLQDTVTSTFEVLPK